MFSEGHNNGIIEAIPIDHTGISSIFFLISKPGMILREGRISTIFCLVYRYGFDDTIIMCVKTVLCIQSGIMGNPFTLRTERLAEWD